MLKILNIFNGLNHFIHFFLSFMNRSEYSIKKNALIMRMILVLGTCVLMQAEQESASPNVVVQSNQPTFGKIILKIKEDLRIGNDTSKNVMFYRIRDIGTDKEENIYIVDSGNYRIQKYDRNGKYLLTIGRQGQGPGEFERPTRIRIDDRAGLLYILDGSLKIDVFKKNGIFIRSVKCERVVYDFVPTGLNELWAIMNAGSDNEITSYQALVKLNAYGKIEKVVIRYPYTLFMQRTSTGIAIDKTGYELALHLAKIDDEYLIYGYSKNYELFKISLDYRILLKIRNDNPRPKFTAEEKEEFKHIPLPLEKPFYYKILVDSEKRIYVQRNKNDVIMRGLGPIEKYDKEVDVFNTKGDFLFTTMLPANSFRINNGFIYAFHIDEEIGTESVLRYRIIDWENIPSKILNQK